LYRVTVNSDTAPAAAGPYSHAVRVSGELLFISGQIPLDAASGELVGTTPAEQTRKCLENLHAIASDAACSLEEAVKVTIYLTDMGAFAEVNEAYSEFFKSNPPARVCIAVVALPKGAQVEIDAVVAVGA
jgi:2-iminobutanoate/2-iminopropanoate deaminase